MSAKHFFNNEQKLAIQEAIANAEKNTSGEVRVHIDSKCKGDALNQAVEIFGKLKMHETALRNGVLFYLATDDKKFAIVGDEGINNVVPKNFWDDVKNTMLTQFKSGAFTEGLCKGIEMAGEKLKQHFPYKSDDINELNDEISFGS